jgi:hypothetical protein
VDGAQRTGKPNPALESRFASDIWMHVRGMPSAHVLIKNQKGKQPPPRVLEEAARWLATATRSASRKTAGSRDSDDEGERIEIIYTEAKWGALSARRSRTRNAARFQTLLVRV